ncbi:MAG TPA: beta-propeller fold lactonase family protein [Gemmatimonadota bacterium]|nr:beta-propeller fold lactonase family protein [Gemmatimonadota bacterium]
MPRISVLAIVLSALATACAAAQTAPGGQAGPAAARDSAYVLFVGLESEDAVAVVDPVAGTVLRKVPVGISTEDIEGVHALAVSPDGSHYYLSIAHGWPYGSIWKMTTRKDSLVARTNVGLFPATIALTPDGTWLFVANYNLHGDPALDTVSAVHTPTMTEVSQIPVCTKPHGMVASHDGRWIYASCTRDNVVRKISVESLTVVDSTNMLTDEDRDESKVCYPAGLALSRDDSKLFVACHRDAEIRVLSTDALGSVTNTIPTGEGPYLIRMGPEGERLWVPNRNDQSYTVIDVAEERAIATRPSSASHPHTFAFGPDGRVYLSMESHAVVPGAIDVIDPATLETVRSIEVGLQATGVGVVPLPPSHFR